MKRNGYHSNSGNSSELPGPVSTMNGVPAYHQPTPPIGSSFGLSVGAAAGVKKYSPVSPPTAPKPFVS